MGAERSANEIVRASSGWRERLCRGQERRPACRRHDKTGQIVAATKDDQTRDNRPRLTSAQQFARGNTLTPFKVWPVRYSQNLGWPVARSYMSPLPWGAELADRQALLQLLRHETRSL